MSDLDRRVRLAAFHWLTDQVRIQGDVLPRSILAQGFVFENQRVPLVGPQGIFKPRLLPQMPLSITTSPEGPYDDSFGPDGLLLYKYRGTDPQHRDNAGLRMAFFRKIPLIYFHGIVPGKYLAVWPVFIAADNPQKLTFEVAVDDLLIADFEEMENATLSEPASQARRAYLTTAVKQRLHQRGFRERVLRAYRDQCAFCRLRHLELLDAAHIIPDGEPGGEPTVNNGISLCRFHHAAFDHLLMGIRPDFIIEVRKDVLKEEDGPMLIYGLQGLHMKQIFVPRSKELRPNPDLLERRYEQFRTVG